MNKATLAILGFLGVGVVAVVMAVLMYFTYSNAEIRLRNAIKAKQADNKNEMDNMWKSISQVAQVTEEERKSLMEVFNGYAGARTPAGDNKAIVKWIHEAIPNVDNKTFLNLQNIIVAKRDGFTMRQKELLDLNREHDNCIDVAPSSFFVGGRGKIDVVIVTSTRTERSFETGKDDDTDLFSRNKSSNTKTNN
jgi:hypothetical protein